MRVEILIKYHNDSYEQFECRINKKVEEFEEYQDEIIDIDILKDGKQIVAIIKYK